ncbi:MAG: transposase [Planctomycetaceae bacterium]|jgi:transposase|nr:transposase [Planctomycetaceae bacterium]
MKTIPTEMVLCPALHKGDIVVMDHMTVHRDPKVKTLMESKRASVLYLPPYCPDLNPIELSFSKLKTLLRKEKIRDVGKLQEFLHGSEKFFSSTDGKNDFKHNGYCTRK